MTDDASTHNSSFQAENFDSAVNGHSPKFSESTKMPIDDIPSDFEGSDLSSIHSDSESPPLKIMRPSTPIRSNPGPRNTRSPFKAGKTKYNARKKSDTIYAKDIDLDNWPIEDFIHSPKASSMPNTPTKKSKPKNAQPAKASDSTTSNVNKRNRVGRTKLFRSVERGDFEQCKEFVEEGADTTLRDNGGWGLIHIACGKGHLEIAKFLIEKGAPINITGLYGQTPLHDAAQINHFGLVKLLLESGAHINSRDCQGKTALDMSEDEDIIVYIKQILQQIHQNQYRDEKGQTSLHLACIQGDLDLANKYLDEGSNINAKDDEGWTSLHRAALYGHADIVNELITRNVDVNAHGYLGDTPLHDACYNNHFDIVELLLQNGADPFLCNDNDEFPLHVATDSEVQSILKEFVDRPKVTTLRRNAKRALQFKEHSPVNHLIAAAVDQPETENFSKQQLKENGEEEENDVEQEVEMKQEMEMEVDSNLNNISMSAELTSVSELSDIGDTETESLDKVEVKLSNEYPELKMEFKESIDCKITNQNPPIKNQDEKNKLSPQSPKLFTPHSPPEKPPRKKRQRNTLSSKDIETLKSTLYMVSIPLADNPSTLFVVDLQVQLVLDMTLPEEGLISLYPYLYRRQVTKPEKERLWKHFRRILEPLIEISVGKVGPDQKIGKKDFLKLVMNFVKMDEIIDLIKDKYSNLSSNLITIELDLGYNESNSAEEPSKKQNLKLISPTSIDLPEKPLIISPECSATESQPVKREPSSSLDFILGPSSPKRISSPKQLASPRIPSLKNILDNPDILDNPYPTSTPTSPVQSPNNRMPPKLARKLRHRNSISDHGGYQHI